MNPRLVWRSLVVLLFVTLGAAPDAEAQQLDARLDDVTARFQSGVAYPVGGFGDFVDPGPTFGVDLGYPVRDRLDLMLNLDLDLVRKHDIYAVPDMRLWRYQLGTEADLLGRRTSDVRVLGYVGAGATSFSSETFYPGTDPQKFSNTYFTGTGGLRLGLETSPGFRWWLNGELNWSPVDEEDTEVLSQAARNELKAFGSATNVAFTIGFSVPR